MPALKRRQNTNPAIAAQIALVVAVCSLIVSLVGVSVLASVGSSSNKRIRNTQIGACKDLNNVKAITIQALEAAIVRAQSSEGDLAVRQASIKELRREISLLKPDPSCAVENVKRR